MSEVNDVVIGIDYGTTQSTACYYDPQKEEVTQITDRQLGIKNILSHILKIDVFPEKLLVTFDIFPPLEVVVHQINYRKREFIIPQD